MESCSSRMPVAIDQRFISTVSDTSYDDQNGKSLVDSPFPVANFDAMKTDYAIRRGISEPRSADALHVGTENSVALIEFKSGVMSRRKSYEVLEKAYDSVVILLDKTGWTMDQFRARTDFILVYSFEKNLAEEKCEGKRDALSNPPSYSKISGALHSLAEEPAIRFGLAKLENHCYRKVRTYSEAEFVSEFLENAHTALSGFRDS